MQCDILKFYQRRTRDMESHPMVKSMGQYLPSEYNRETGTDKEMSFVEIIVGTSYLSFCSCPGLVW